MNQSPPSSGGSGEMYPRVRLGQAPLAIQDQECQRVIRLIAMLSQQRSTQIALHRNQVKRGLTLVMLQPPRPATTEVAQTIQKQLLGFGFPLCAAHTTIVSKPRTTASIVTDSPILTPRGSGNATAAGDARLLAGPGLSEWSAAVDPDLPGFLWLLVVARLRGQV